MQANAPGKHHSVGRAMLILVIALMFAPAMDALAKILATEHSVSPASISLGRFIVQSVFLSLFVAVIWQRRIAKAHLSYIDISRGVLMGATTIVFFVAIKYLPLADAISIFFVEPLIVMLLSAVFLGETVGWRRIVAAIIGFCGAIIIIQPSFDLFGPVSLLPLLAAFLFSIYLILTRIAGSHNNPFVMQFYAGIGGIIMGSIGVTVGTLTGIENLAFTIPQTYTAWGLLIGLGLFAVFTHLMIVIAFSMAQASILAPFQYLEIVGATLLGYIIFGDFPNITKWIGIAIIVGSGVYIFMRERKLEQQAMGKAEPATNVSD